MAARPRFARPPILSQLLAALLACTLSGSLLGAVSALFEGAPFARAELECTPLVRTAAEAAPRAN